MSNENDELDPLKDEEAVNDEILKPLTFNRTEPINNENVPIANSNTNDIKNKDSNYIFFFGGGSCGKSVILATMLYYMRSQVGVIRPKVGTPNTIYAESLLYDFFDNIRKGILPTGTQKDEVTRLDLVFEPNNKSKKIKPINLTFLETNGENHNEIKRGGQYISSIEEYLTSYLKLSFIIVTSYENAHEDDILINTFLDKLVRYEKKIKSINLILVISKWDLSGSTTVESELQLENFIKERLPMTANSINTYGFGKSFYTIGKIDNATNRVTLLNLNTAKVLTHWLYQSITGYPLDYPGTLWERIKFSF